MKRVLSNHLRVYQAKSLKKMSRYNTNTGKHFNYYKRTKKKKTDETPRSGETLRLVEVNGLVI